MFHLAAGPDFVIDRPPVGTNSIPVPLPPETIYFHWTYGEKGLEFSASLGSCIQRHWSALLL